MNTQNIIRNCSNCEFGCLKEATYCGVGGRYDCDQHSLTVDKPMVYIASALRGDIEGNLKKAGIYTKLAMDSNVLPITPHLSWATILDDTIPEERKLGMSVGAELLLKCDAVWVFGFISEGVQSEIDLALRRGIPVYIIDDESVLPCNPELEMVTKLIRSCEHADDPCLVIGNDNFAIVESGQGEYREIVENQVFNLNLMPKDEGMWLINFLEKYGYAVNDKNGVYDDYRPFC